MNIAILIPTYFRTHGLRKLLQSLKDTAPLVHPVIVIEQDDRQAAMIGKQFEATIIICLARRRGPVLAWNTGLATVPGFDAYILGADDCYYLPGWYEAMIETIDNNGGSGLFALNDGTSCQHYLMTRDFIIQHHGGVMAVPHYTGWGLDFEAVERAKIAGQYYFCERAKIVHDWHGSAGRISPSKDQATFEARKLTGFPDDFPPILELEFPQ